MTFATARLLWLLAAVPALAGLSAWAWRRRLRATSSWAARGLWDRLLVSYDRRRLVVSVVLLCLAFAAVCLALARPRWGGVREHVERRGVDIVFILDSSLSMAARDVAPSRLDAAKTVVRRLVRELPGNRVALVEAAGDGVVMTPLTVDAAVIDLILDGITAGGTPVPGTRLAPALEAAAKLFPEGGERHRAIVLVSDGEDHGGGMDQEARKLAERGIVVHVLGIGTPQGGPIPLAGRGPGAFKRDRDDHVVVSQLGEQLLEQLARATGGVYLRTTSPGVDPRPVVRRIDAMEKRTFDSELLETRAERFQWPLAAAVCLLALFLGCGPFRPQTEVTP